tara:strand:+ start:7934 stop:8101 length:168 start_codon:yes stop_codon:yes gene_type:complete
MKFVISAESGQKLEVVEQGDKLEMTLVLNPTSKSSTQVARFKVSKEDIKKIGKAV